MNTRSTRRTAQRKPTPRRANTRRTPRYLVPACVAGAALTLIVTIALIGSTCSSSGVNVSSIDNCEQWREVVTQACDDCKLGSKWADAVLALMAVESGGDTEVASVLGVQHDIMQAAEGAYGDIVMNGSEKYGVAAETPEASIYAGVLEFKQNRKLWKKYLDGITPDEPQKIQLVIQGYNFGADGWYNWCAERGVSEYTVELAQEYSDAMMPEGAKGTPTHAEKWLGYYKQLHG